MSSKKPAFMLSIVLGVALVVLGAGAYVLSDFASITALIPAIFGVLIAILGVWDTDGRIGNDWLPTGSACWQCSERWDRRAESRT